MPGIAQSFESSAFRIAQGKIGNRHARENRKGKFGTDAAYAEQQLEHILFRLRQKTEKREGVFAKMGMDMEADL